MLPIPGRSGGTLADPRPPIYQFKAVIPPPARAPCQGIVNHPLRLCIREGDCRRARRRAGSRCRQLKEMVHVKDEDIATLDAYVIKQGNASESAQGICSFVIMALIAITVIVSPAVDHLTNGTSACSCSRSS